MNFMKHSRMYMTINQIHSIITCIQKCGLFRQGMTPSILSHPQGNDTLFRSTRKGRAVWGIFTLSYMVRLFFLL